MAKILLVEDDNNLREIYEARLKAEGYEIAGASNGEEALVVAKKEQPDLVIADVMMPRISGFEMLDILRNTQGLEHVKVIMLTALGQAEDKTRADQLGADRYLVKSQVTLEDIVKAASDLLGGGASAPTPAPATTSPAAQPEPANAGANAATQQQQPQAAPAQSNPSPPAQQAQTPPPHPAFQPVSPPPEPQGQQQKATPAPSPMPPTPKPDTSAPQPTPAQQQPAQPQTPPQPAAQAPQKPATPPAAPDNTSQLNDAVKDLMNGTASSTAQPAAPKPQPPKAPAATNNANPDNAQAQPAQPEPDKANNDNDSVTISGKRTIAPLSPDAGARPHINDLLAKETAESGAGAQSGQPAGGTTPQQGMSATPHPAGHVITPAAGQPQNNQPPAPNDPNSISL